MWLWRLPHFFASLAPAQEYLVSVQHYSVPQGLFHRYTRHTAQDSRGFIWVATYDGINRFDGFEFQQYASSTPRANCFMIFLLI
ncbi:MAG: hypothetical protein H6557_05885 [Lewinellaceae bacterium]|nr:hypothetical protein [Lewinellaceae bacterium]